jgi:prevent-host-death family protein
MANRMSTADARKDFAALLRSSAAGQRTKLTRYNKTVAVIIPKKDLDELEDCQRRRRGSRSSSAALQASGEPAGPAPRSGARSGR